MVRPARGTNDSESDVPSLPGRGRPGRRAFGFPRIVIPPTCYSANLGNSDSIIYSEVLPGISDDSG